MFTIPKTNIASGLADTFSAGCCPVGSPVLIFWEFNRSKRLEVSMVSVAAVMGGFTGFFLAVESHLLP